jgi:hypothetical protein
MKKTNRMSRFEALGGKISHHKVPQFRMSATELLDYINLQQSEEYDWIHEGD